MKTMHMAVAVIRSEDRIFVCQRGYGDVDHGWEFPGVYYEKGEYGPSKMVEEIFEEFDTLVEVEDLICTIEYDYPETHVVMECYWCKVKKGYLEGVESDIMHWLRPSELHFVEWLPADQLLVNHIVESFQS